VADLRRVSIFGATGSVGKNTVDLIDRSTDQIKITAITGGENISLLASQARQLRPDVTVTANPKRLNDLRDALAGSGLEAAAGEEAIVEAADRETDWSMSAIVGSAGIRSGLASLKHGGYLALANKETMVAAGALTKTTAAEFGATLLPVDSEHSALFQILRGSVDRTIDRVILTASGGPFRDQPVEELHNVTPAMAAAHPNWAMGKRISIDSASMFNKALEVIEAQALFGLRPDQIDVVIHPQSLVHALVEYKDGAMLAHLGSPDMRAAIGYALNYPECLALPVAKLDLASMGSLEFSAADEVRWPALRLARQVLEFGEPAGAVFNAAKEAALDEFIGNRIGFLEMAIFVEEVLQRCSSEGLLNNPASTIDDILNLDAQARVYTSEAIGRKLAS
jgi:1-deoxy-D-xylulose-5-phosphate reductoisomerase